jgi:hypothetical protein
MEKLGNAGFAATGNSDYKSVGPGDPVPDWDALEDAKTSSALHKDNVVEMADDWGRRALIHYQIFNSVNPNRVTNFATVNDANILVEGVFAGWDSQRKPTYVVVRITLDQSQSLSGQSLSPKVVGNRYIFPQRDLPYTTNGVTQKLIEGDSKQKQAVAAEWKKASEKFRRSELDWRWIEFLVQSTSDYDETVGKEVDVLEVLPSGSNWLHNSSCSAH